MNAEINNEEESKIPFSCVINARPTIERVFSCFNYFFLQELKLNDTLPNECNVTSSKWNKYLPMLCSMFHQGCNNEFIRNFGTIQDEFIINTMNMKPSSLHKKSNMQALHELDNIFKRVSKCVVTTLPKCNEGLEVMNYYLPWLQRHSKCDCGVKVNQGQVTSSSSSSKTNEPLDANAEKVMLEHNFLDELAHDFIDALFEEQLKVARENK